jgi:hypothetical protein
VVFALAGASAYLEVVDHLLSSSTDTPAVLVFQLITGSAAVAAAVGIWRRAPWAALAVLIYGAVTAIFVVLLGPMLDLGADERSGLLTGAAAILAFSLASAWYVRHVARRGTLSSEEPPARPD